MSPVTLTPRSLRLILLAAQGLLQPPAHLAEKPNVLETIRRIGALQIDTIHIVARAPYFTLFSRLGAYNPAWLDEHLREGRLFEYWAHAACFLPIEDYPIYRHRMNGESQGYYSSEWAAQHRQTIEAVMARIRESGAVRSADFERSDGRKGTWWDWKEEKRALEYLHTTGELMIAQRVNFQRVYDLRERVQPDFADKVPLSTEAAHDELCVRAVRCLGAAPARWVADYFRLPKQGMPARLERLAAEGRLLKAAIDGWDAPAYFCPDHLPLLEAAAGGELTASHTTLLTPFDPLVWDRQRARELFGFEFTIECYLPAAKRRYGYFPLPILHHDRLVGRLDAKAHRKENMFEIISLYLEPDIEPTAELASDLAEAIQRCADWHNTPQMEFRRTEPSDFLKMIEAQRAGRS